MPIDNVLMNDKKSTHNEEIVEEFKIEYVEEVKQ